MKNQPRKMTKGFSLLELMITVTVAGIIAAFAIPNYIGSVNRANEKDIINQMNIIHAAQNSYFARSGNIFMFDTNLVLDINDALGLHIIANGNTYSMNRGAGGTTYTLTVSRGGIGAMSIVLTEAAWNPKFSGGPGNPRCNSGCPTLK